MMGRVAAILILASQLVLVWLALQPNGTTAIWFSFVGHPLLAIGCILGILRPVHLPSNDGCGICHSIGEFR